MYNVLVDNYSLKNSNADLAMLPSIVETLNSVRSVCVMKPKQPFYDQC